MAAATRVIAAEGLAAPTAAIAKEAGVSNGSLFTYFPTKADLLNQLYIELKAERAAAAMDGLPETADLRALVAHTWQGQMRWAIADPDKRRAWAHLNVSEEITAESREAGHRVMAPVAALLERVRSAGPMREAPLAFLVALMNAIGDATIDFMAADPKNAKRHGETGFEALWRVLS